MGKKSSIIIVLTIYKSKNVNVFLLINLYRLFGMEYYTLNPNKMAKLN